MDEALSDDRRGSRTPEVSAIIDAELVCTGDGGIAEFDRLHCRGYDHEAIACAFDVMMLECMDLRRETLEARKARLRKLLARAGDGLRYVAHTAGDGEEMFKSACKLWLEGIVSKRVTAPYRSGRAKSWRIVKNPASPAMLRIDAGQA
jgi:bifunctional non-homologous end joining protein LigD